MSYFWKILTTLKLTMILSEGLESICPLKASPFRLGARIAAPEGRLNASNTRDQDRSALKKSYETLVSFA
jgi:hypothetical protein